MLAWIVIAAARGILSSCDKSKLEEYGGSRLGDKWQITSIFFVLGDFLPVHLIYHHVAIHTISSPPDGTSPIPPSMVYQGDYATVQ